MNDYWLFIRHGIHIWILAGNYKRVCSMFERAIESPLLSRARIVVYDNLRDFEIMSNG